MYIVEMVMTDWWRTGWEGKCQNDPYIFVFLVPFGIPGTLEKWLLLGKIRTAHLRCPRNSSRVASLAVGWSGVQKKNSGLEIAIQE